MILTEDLILKAKSANGGWTKAQLAAIGVGWPPPKGWKKNAAGKEITREQYARFLTGKPAAEGSQNG